MSLVVESRCQKPPVGDSRVAEPPSEPRPSNFIKWSQIAACFSINALSWGFPNAFGVFQLYYEENLELPPPQIAWIGSIQTFLTFVVCTPAGRLSDAGYARHVLLTGSLLVVLGTMSVSFSSEYWQILLAQGICAGIGLGFIFMPTVSVITAYFEENKGFALALAATGTGFGGVLWPALMKYLSPAIGFSWATRSISLIVLAMLVFSNILIKPTLPARKSGPLIEFAAFRELPYFFFALGCFIIYYALFFGNFYINKFAREALDFSPIQAVELLMIANGAGTVVRPFVGYAGDQILGSINAFMTSTTALAAVLYGWTGVNSRSAMYTYSVFYGLASGCVQGTFVGANASLTSDPQKMGTRFGMIQTIIAFSILAGPPTAGAIIDNSGGDFIGSQVWGGTMVLVGTCFIVAARVSRSGFVFKYKV